jgi:hypothetical protein
MVLGYPGLTVPLVCGCVWYFGTLGLRYPWMLGFYRYLTVRAFPASRMVLRLLLESSGTLVAVSAPLVMPLHDSDIPTNVPFTFRNKQPYPPSEEQVQGLGPVGAPPSASITERGANARTSGAPPSASTTDREANAKTARAPPSASTTASGAAARTAGAPPSASTTDRAANARPARAPPSGSITAAGASARTAGAPPSAPTAE